jgi:hypothetical protein
MSLATSPDPVSGPTKVLGPNDALPTTLTVTGAWARSSAVLLTFTSQNVYVPPERSRVPALSEAPRTRTRP